MNRRHFLRGSAGMAAASWPAAAFARTACGPYFPNGVQRCEAGIDSALAYIPAQDRSQWCWAASIAMVFGYYGHPVSQQDIVGNTWGSIVNMPAQPGQILANLNRPWIDDYGRPFGVMGDVLSANPISAAQDLAQDMPLIIGTLGHAMVLTALVYDRAMNGNGEVVAAIVRDPWPGRGRRVLSAQEWYQANFLARIRVV